jgi:hypothetical protein
MSQGQDDVAPAVPDESALKIARQQIRKMDEESNRKMENVSREEKNEHQGAA